MTPAAKLIADDPYIRAMFGQSAIHVPFNAIVQGDDETCALAAVICSPLPRFRSRKTHQLIMGDAIIRPRLVAHTDRLKGYGITGLFTSGFQPEYWTDVIIKDGMLV